MITIDGSHHEGGGQIIRTAVALSALTGKAVRIEKIRAGRPNPGLAAQHIAAVEAVAKLCNAKVRGADIGSQVLEFEPKKITGGESLVKISTAGSIGLVLQALLIPAAFAEKPLKIMKSQDGDFKLSKPRAFERGFKIRIDGGATFGKWAPPVLYLEHVVLPNLSRAGINFKINVLKEGFYPKGGALVEVETELAKPKKIELLERGEVRKICGISIASNHLKNARVAERQKDAAIRALEPVMEMVGKTVEIKAEYVDASCPGSGIVLWADCGSSVLGADAIGELYLPAEKVGENAAKKLLKQIDSGACLDEWMADQIVPYLALAEGVVKVAEITPHTETNIWVVEQFLGNRFEVDKAKNILCVKTL